MSFIWVSDIYEEVKYKREFNYEITYVININSVIFIKLYVVILMKNYFTQFWVCSIV